MKCCRQSLALYSVFLFPFLSPSLSLSVCIHCCQFRSDSDDTSSQFSLDLIRNDEIGCTFSLQAKHVSAINLGCKRSYFYVMSRHQLEIWLTGSFFFILNNNNPHTYNSSSRRSRKKEVHSH